MVDSLRSLRTEQKSTPYRARAATASPPRTGSPWSQDRARMSGRRISGMPSRLTSGSPVCLTRMRRSFFRDGNGRVLAGTGTLAPAALLSSRYNHHGARWFADPPASAMTRSIPCTAGRPARTGGLMSYVDGFVLPVARQKLADYRRMARKAGKIWIEHGALQYTECVGDDVKPGKLTSFPQSVKLKDDEVVVFSWIVYRTRKDRDRIMEKVMADPRLAAMMTGKDMPFDGKRMFWGGFKSMIEM
jgi:uncharacterized protein YbaA (DUF1428 family)